MSLPLSIRWSLCVFHLHNNRQLQFINIFLNRLSALVIQRWLVLMLIKPFGGLMQHRLIHHMWRCAKSVYTHTHTTHIQKHLHLRVKWWRILTGKKGLLCLLMHDLGVDAISRHQKVQKYRMDPFLLFAGCYESSLQTMFVCRMSWVKVSQRKFVCMM